MNRRLELALQYTVRSEYYELVTYSSSINTEYF